ncbi:MAG TPA: polyphenol oxidase family protein [Nocardioidaceae bacterium]
MFAFLETRGPVEVAFTDRHDGGADHALDLAEPKPGEDPGAWDGLQENIDVVAYALARGGEAAGDNPFELPAGARLPVVVRMRQVHGSDVHTVTRIWLEARHPEPPEVDGLVTDLPGVALLVRMADCVPVLLADPGRGVIGAAHAGRLGLAAGVVPATVSRMRELGAERVVAWIGPHVCGRCYEVPEEMRTEVAAAAPAAFAETSWGTPALDVGAGIVAQLEAEGVEVVDASRCTLEDDDLYSYRRQGESAGRLGGLVWVRP